jgi:hypothetical protein
LSKLNVIGDVTGFAATLRLLVEAMPKGKLWGLGDLIDRGPDSKGVLDFFIDGKHKSLMGNHEHMMLFEKIRNNTDVHHRLYPPGCWGWNGGQQTAESFGYQFIHEFDWKKHWKYFEFIEKMPLRYQKDDLMLTHAPISDRKSARIYDLKEINKNVNLMEISALWNRYGPTKVAGKLQVYGHNSTKGILWHTDRHPQGIYMADPLEVPDGAWAVCIDTWREGYLSGLHIDTTKLANPKEAIQIFRQKVTDPFDFETPKKKRMKGIYEI